MLPCVDIWQFTCRILRSHTSPQCRRMGVALVVKLHTRCLASMNSMVLFIPMPLLTFTNCWSMMITDMMTSYWLLIPSQVGDWFYSFTPDKVTAELKNINAAYVFTNRCLSGKLWYLQKYYGYVTTIDI